MKEQALFGRLSYPIRISATALNNFGACPRKFLYYRFWDVLGDEPSYFAKGREVHEIMEGSLVSSRAMPAARAMAERLQKTERGLGIRIFQREMRQSFEISPDFLLTRVVDGLGVDKDGKPIIVDYKTASRKWATSGVPHFVAYKAHTWQSICYLLSPPKSVQSSEWPKELIYMVATSRSAQIFPVEYKKEDHANFLIMLGNLKQMIDTDTFYKNPSWTCQWCPYSDMCNELDGWEANFRRKK